MATTPLLRSSVVAVALIAAACGGDGEASVGTVPPTSVAVETTAAPTTSAAPTTTTTTTEAPDLVGTPAFDASSSVSTVGIDRVQFGMTVARAESALGASLVPVGTANGECYQIRPEGGPVGVELTVTAGTIERVDVTTDLITTRSGAGVGSTEDELFALFGDRLTSAPRAGGGNDLIFTPADANDAAFRVIFSTDGTTTTSFRSGRVGVIEAETGC